MSDFDVQKFKFIESLPVLTEAQGGLARVRQLVLNLAIRGKLSRGREGDGSTTELLRLADTDRVERQQRGAARQMNELGAVTTGEAPFVVPTTWAWTRVGLAMNLVNGRAFKPTDWSVEGLPIIRIQNLNNPSAGFNYCNFDVEPKHKLKSGDFLISWSGTPGTSFGAFIWDGPPGVLNQHIFRVEQYGNIYEPRFLRIVINARLDEMIARAHGGVGLQHITKGDLEHVPIPLPPVAEQKRIVAKVDELMRLIDDLEARQVKTLEVQTRFRSSALDAVTKAEGPEELALAWKRVGGKFELLFDGADTVGELRSRMLELAMRGRLTKANPSDDSVDDLIERLDADVGATGKTYAAVEEAPYTIPSRWRWIRWGQLTHGTSSGWSPQCENRRREGGEWGVLKVSAVSWFAFKSEENKALPNGVQPRPEFVARTGDFLMSRANTADLVGRSVIVGGAPERLLLSDKLVRVEFSPLVEKEFVNLYNRTAAARTHYVKNASGTSDSMKNISRDVILTMPLPLPPRAEQKRIVAKVEHLMKLCDDFETKLRAKEATASKLVEAVVRELVA